MHPNLGKFVVEKLSYAKPDEMVYLTSDARKDSNGVVQRHWAFAVESAQVYKLRANADRAAARWGGVVRRLDA